MLAYSLTLNVVGPTNIPLDNTHHTTCCENLKLAYFLSVNIHLSSSSTYLFKYAACAVSVPLKKFH